MARYCGSSNCRLDEQTSADQQNLHQKIFDHLVKAHAGELLAQAGCVLGVVDGSTTNAAAETLRYHLGLIGYAVLGRDEIEVAEVVELPLPGAVPDGQQAVA